MPPRKEQQAETPSYSEWFRSTTEPKQGVIELSFQSRPVAYSEIDGLAILEGDIVLGKAAEVPSEMPQITISDEELTAIAHGVAITGERFRWPRGEVPFEIAAGVSANTRQIITNAINHWHQNTQIRLIPRRPEHTNFVRFISGNGCYSSVGMRGGMQDISIGTGCGFGAAVHEIGHAVGLWHEQSREDRDRFITVNWANITPGMEHNFNQHITDGDDIGNYDFGSIMHYGPTAFSRNGQPTIVTTGGQAIGQRNGLSAGDIAAVRWMYPNLEPSRTWSGVQFRGSVPANATRSWFTHSWPSYWYVIWTITPLAPIQNRAAQLEWRIQVERQTEKLLKYYIVVKNLSSQTVSFEARYDVLGWSRAAR